MPLTQAQAQKLLVNLPPGGTIELKKLPSGEFIVTAQPKTKQELIDEKYSRLKGQGISISDAAKKYGVPRKSVENWVYQSGYIDIVDSEVYPQLIDESEVALCAEIYHQRQKIRLTGIPYFDNDGYVITNRKHPGLAQYRRRRKAAAAPKAA